jgi:hypothetical protein
MTKRKNNQLIESERFQTTAISLLKVQHADWTDWEHEWLWDQARRPAKYTYSDNQQHKLEQLLSFSKSYTQYGSYTVQELLRIAFLYRFDLDETDQEFVETLHHWQATDLKLRQMRRLVRICRMFEIIERGELDEAA